MTKQVRRDCVSGPDAAEKRCAKCDTVKPRGEFPYRSRRAADGSRLLASECKACRRARRRALSAKRLAGAVYERDYLLGTSFARPLIAKHMVEIAEAEGAESIATFDRQAARLAGGRLLQS